MNGGLRYFFQVGHPGNPPYELIGDIYRQIDAPIVADCILDTAKVFQFTDPHLKPDDRADRMWSLEQELQADEMLFDSFDAMIFAQDLDSKILSYMRQHFDQFPVRRT